MTNSDRLRKIEVTITALKEEIETLREQFSNAVSPDAKELDAEFDVDDIVARVLDAVNSQGMNQTHYPGLGGF